MIRHRRLSAVLLAAALAAGCDAAPEGASSGVPPAPPEAAPLAPPPAGSAPAAARAPVPPAPPPSGVPDDSTEPSADPTADRDRLYEFRIRQARTLAAEARRLQDRGVLRRAVDAYLGAAPLRPDDPRPLAEAGVLGLELGDGAVATRMLELVHARAPDSAAFHFLRGSMYLLRGEFADAVADLRKCQNGDFEPEAAKDRLFRALWSQGLMLIEAADLHGAVRVLTETVELSPRHPLVVRAWWDLAVAHRRLSQPAEAEKILRDLTERFATYAPSYGELGSLLAEQDRHEEAQDWLDRSIRVDPGYAQGYLLRADLLSARGRVEEAEASLREYAARFQPSAESEYQWGLVLHRRGDHRAAIDRFRSALAIDPGRIRALNFIARCWRALDEPEEERAALERWRRAYDAFLMARRMHEEKARDTTGASGGGEAPEAGGTPPPPPADLK